MSRIVQRRVKGRRYYYLEESLKKGRKWVKKSAYLGASLPEAPRLAAIYRRFAAQLRKEGALCVVPPHTEFITRKIALQLENAAKGKAEFIRSLSERQKQEFIRRERITFVTDSNAIEGSTLDYGLTERVLLDQARIERFQKKGILMTGMGREEQEALNLNKCIGLYGKYLARREDISEKMILQFHFILLSKIEGYEQYRGIWRPVNVMIRGSRHTFPPYQEVPGLMHQLLECYNENKELMHPVELAAKFHSKFTTIHPFADGNGRMARLLMNYILQLNGVPFTNIPLKRRSTYMRTQETGHMENYRPFTLFLAEEAIKQCNRLGRTRRAQKP